MQSKRICYLDSLCDKYRGSRLLEGVLTWLADEHMDKKKVALRGDFEMVPCTTESMPQQSNAYDCGVYCIMAADFLSDDLNIHELRKERIPLFRQKIAHHIIKGELYYDSAPSQLQSPLVLMSASTSSQTTVSPLTSIAAAYHSTCMCYFYYCYLPFSFA
jgi:Ulp1 family protease